MWVCVHLSLCLQSLSRLTLVVPTVFLAVIDSCSSAAILEGVGGAGARVQQHLLTAMAAALLTSRIQIHRVTQSKVHLAHLHHKLRVYYKNVKWKLIQLTRNQNQNNRIVLMLYFIYFATQNFYSLDGCKTITTKQDWIFRAVKVGNITNMVVLCKCWGMKAQKP